MLAGMRLPGPADLAEFCQGVIRTCTNDLERRRAFYSRLTNNYLTGTDGLDSARHNVLQEVIKESSADLYADGMARFGVDVDQQYGDDLLDEEEAVGEDAQRWWHNSRSGKAMAKAVEWAHVWPAAVLKVFVEPGEGEVLVRMLPNTADLGLLSPNVPEWENQEGLVQSFSMDLSSFERRVRHRPYYRELMRTALATAQPPDGRDAMPAAFRSIILAQWTPNLIGMPSGGALGQTGVELTMADPQSREPEVRLKELWVWDDAMNDYRVVTMMAESALLVDDHGNPLVPKAHPFFPVILDPLPFSAWSVPVMVGILKMQMMHESFLEWITNVLGMQFDPPLVATGVAGMLEEKLDALRSPGGDFTNPLPQGKVENFAPSMPPDAFPMLSELKQMMGRRVGRPPAMTGGGDPSRSGDQVIHKALLSAGATLNRAMAVEGAVEAVATYGARLRHRINHVPLRNPADGSEFLLNQFPEEFVIKVDAHSISPIAQEQNREKIMFLIKEGAITKEDAIRLLGIPQMDRMARKARRLGRAQAALAKQRMAIEETKAAAKMESAKK